VRGTATYAHAARKDGSKAMKLRNLGLALAGLSLAGAASAVTAYDTITAAVDFSDVLTAAVAVAAVVAGILVGIRGIRFVMSVVRR